LIKLQITLLFLLSILVSCGTDTGNPGETARAGLGQDRLLFVNRFVEATCLQIQSCHEDQSITDCEALYTEQNMPASLGWGESDFENLNGVLGFEMGGQITPNEETANSCLEEIKNLSCETSEMREAFDGDSTRPFEKANRVIPARCQSVFE